MLQYSHDENNKRQSRKAGRETMKKLLNLKNMKETIVNYSGDQKEFDKIWDAFYQMACIGFIDSDV